VERPQGNVIGGRGSHAGSMQRSSEDYPFQANPLLRFSGFPSLSPPDVWTGMLTAQLRPHETRVTEALGGSACKLLLCSGLCYLCHPANFRSGCPFLMLSLLYLPRWDQVPHGGGMMFVMTATGLVPRRLLEALVMPQLSCSCIAP
jgi:hypothetical protein